jgi:hypothetical protein
MESKNKIHIVRFLVSKKKAGNANSHNIYVQPARGDKASQPQTVACGGGGL